MALCYAEDATASRNQTATRGMARCGRPLGTTAAPRTSTFASLGNSIVAVGDDFPLAARGHSRPQQVPATRGDWLRPNRHDKRALQPTGMSARRS
jgi:hypothetical protein